MAPSSSPEQNQLLLSLPPSEETLLGSKLETVTLEFRKILAAPDQPSRHIYFLDSGMISLVKPMQDGAAVEVGLIGREGFVGVNVLLGDITSPVEQMVQVAGSARRITTADFQSEMVKCPTLLARLQLFAQTTFSQITQTAACNGRHKLQERLARWLLMASDRLGTHQLPLSHELLSMMLGVRRPGITVALGALRRAGITEGGQGKITIRDRPALEDVACECYGVVRDEYGRLLPA